MDDFIKLSPLLSAMLVSLGFILALIQYKRQLAYKKLENLQKIWKDFLNDDHLFTFFSALDQAPDKRAMKRVADTPYQTKLRFIGLLDEVALLVFDGDVKKEHAIYLFQWLYYYAFKNETTMLHLWKNLGGATEAQKPYWEKARNLAVECNPE
ncbi:MAG TPA: hypothetical protein PLY93_01490 [Turneriella sp.]|nr:hypothetical protein [Turneriella sp.]